jgi:fatty acid desaturase
MKKHLSNAATSLRRSTAVAAAFILAAASTATARWAGFLMFVAGVPVQLVGVWLLLGSAHRIDPTSAKGYQET